MSYRLAERSSGREIAVALANVAFSDALVFLGLFVSTKNLNFQIGGGSVPLHLISDLFLITGAILFRFRWLGLQRQASKQSEPATA